jgi:tetratricopeptide (TPR) repeat protein
MTRPSTAVPLRGREAELRVVSALVKAAAGGAGGAVVFGGDPGTGKSALLAAATKQARAAAAGFMTVEVRGRPGERDHAYGGLHGIRGSDLAPGGAEALAQAEGTGEPLAVSSALLALFVDAARQHPVLCAIDDAHLLDDQSLEAFAFVARRIAAERVALLFAGREVGEDLLPGVESVRLAELDRAASRALLADIAASDLPEEVAGILATAAAGNPRALIDLVGSLTVEQRRGDAPPPRRLPTSSTLYRDLRFRLAPLPAATRWLLLLLAVDQDLDAGELIRAAAVSGLGVEALEPAERAEIIRVNGSAIEFVRPLLRGVVYDEATDGQRREAHLRLAETIDPARHGLRRLLHVARIASGPDPALAEQLEKASDGEDVGHRTAARALARAAELVDEPGLTARYLVRAARHAWLGGEPDRARLLVRHLPATGTPASVRAHADLLVAEIEMWVGDTELARRRMLTLAQRSSDPALAVSAMARAAEAALQSGRYPDRADLAREFGALDRSGESPDTAVIFDLFSGSAATVEGRLAAAEAPLRRAMAAAPLIEDPSSLVRACVAALLLGDCHQAYRLAMRSAAVARTTGEVALVPRALTFAAAAECALGRYDGYRRILLEALPLAQAIGQDAIVSRVFASLAVHAAVFGDAATCRTRIAQARASAGREDRRRDVVIDWAQALLDLAGRRPAQTLSRLQRRLSSWTAGEQLYLGVMAPLLVEAAVGCGRPEAAQDAMVPFHAWAVRTGQPNWLAMAARCRAQLAGPDDEAEREFTEALRHHAAADSRFESARTELLFGQDLRRRGRLTGAREHLRRAAETFQLVDGGVWTEHALRSLRATGVRVSNERSR